MQWNQISDLIQKALLAVGVLVVTLGYASEILVTQIAGVIMALGPLIWGIWDNTRASVIAKANNLEDVQGVITKSTPEGRELAESVPSPTVVSAGTSEARTVAQTTGGSL